MAIQTGTGWIVLKFGGTSVSTSRNWEVVAEVVRERLDEGLRCILVCSALRGVTEELERLFHLAAEGSREYDLGGIRRIHEALASELGIDCVSICDTELARLDELLETIEPAAEPDPSRRARVGAIGEMLSSRMGAAYLQRVLGDVEWLDARDCLTTVEHERASEARRYLSAVCTADREPALRSRLERKSARVFLTQGFVARNPSGETVLLGRGGSDTSAAYFAAKVGAERCEIWTDVPGMFTADPRVVPVARLLRRLDYDEAQEIATMGAKVLHPRCIPPLKQHRIPLLVKCTAQPRLDGTTISDAADSAEPRVKAISTQSGVTLISMDSIGMWQEVGFLADAFACFRERGLSIDLVSTSETTVTVSLDPVSSSLEREAVQAVLGDLNEFCRAELIGPCASVSLVGRRIRAILHRIGPALEAFEEQRIHLVSQAANDLNVTFVVDEDQADRLARRLHGMLFEHGSDDSVFGSTAIQLQRGDEETTTISPRQEWWSEKRERLLELAREESPLYVYDQATLEQAAQSLLEIESLDRLFFSMKANSNQEILGVFERLGLGFECVSFAEVDYILELFPSIDRGRVLFTPNFAPRHEYERGLDAGVIVTLDNLHPLEAWPELFAGKDVFLRIDPGGGRGHHQHVRTAGASSKFGIALTQAERAAELASACGARVTGLHAHRGSGVLGSSLWAETAGILADVASRLPDVRTFDLGGGLGVAEKPGGASLDLAEFDESIESVRSVLPDRAEVWLEPGRFLVAKGGVLLTRVTQVKEKGGVIWVGVDTGMNSLMRPALYGAFHEIVNLSRLDEKPCIRANVVGPICETGDVLGFDRDLPRIEEGDVMLLATAGAYGRVMSSHYNLREPANERMLRRTVED